MSTVKTKHTVTTILVVFALLAGMLAFAVPVGASSATEITVPSGDVDALYAAVYEGGMPRDNVKIFLEPGVYALDTNSRPFDGRLVLGDSTSLESTLRMAVDDNGVPLVQLVDDNLQPTILEEGAVIVGSGLAPDPPDLPDPFGEGIIVVGDRGLVEGLQVIGGEEPGDEDTDPRMPGVEVTSRGEVRKVYSTNNSIGFRIRAATATVQGTFEGNVATGNWLSGISVITPYVDSDGLSGGNKTVRAKVLRNASINNGRANLTVYGGIGTDRNVVHVKAFYNHLRAGPLAEPWSTNVRIVAGQDFWSPGAHDNKVEFVSVGNIIADSNYFGLVAAGGVLQGPYSDQSIDREDRLSSNNEVVVTISDTTFDMNQMADIVAVGSGAPFDRFAPGGQPNATNVSVDTESLNIWPIPCDPIWNFPGGCYSTVDITYNVE